MKTIGRTTDGGYLVEMCESEHRVLHELAHAIEDKSMDEVMFDPGVMHWVDLTTVFSAIKAFTATKRVINDLKALAGDLDNALLGKDT